MRFIQCDDLLTPEEADGVEQLLLSPSFPWFYYGNVNNSAPPPPGTPGIYGADPRFEDAHGFSFVIYPGNDPSLPWSKCAMLVFNKFVKKHEIAAQQVVRVKANLLVRSAAAEGPKPFVPHVDLHKPHWVIIYYVNDSDGDTILLDKTFPDWQNAQITHSISPRKGRAILFDGRHYHCGTAPHCHDTRVVLNFDFV